mmetsp:Transcript_92454/g.261177  ORF Transcript_92454/g.261177 Transcript_92454/m.261177 type:complete len:238 (-) Transcript_92454:85-798(-)
MRAAVLIVSPKSRNRGSFCPMTPATMFPVCIPIFNFTSSDCNLRIWSAARKSLARAGPCPSFSASSTSAGTTPTHATYSSPTVSTLSTLFVSQIESISENLSFKKLRSSCGDRVATRSSKPSIEMNKTVTRSTGSAMGSPGRLMIGLIMCAGIMYSKISNNLLLATLSLRSHAKRVRCDFSKLYLITVATTWDKLRISTLTAMCASEKYVCCVSCLYAKVEPKNTKNIQIHTKCIIS